jgi:Domain of unknown function (DUF6916)
MFERVTKQKFDEQLDTIFTAVWEKAEPMELRLIAIRGLFSSPRNEQFAVEFLCESERFLGQGVQRLQHSVLGEMDIFITPVNRDSKGFYYEAVFNYLVDPADTDTSGGQS